MKYPHLEDYTVSDVDSEHPWLVLTMLFSSH